MRRSDLMDGGLYVGPGGRCYEIVDMTPGWRLDHSGSWVQDASTRTRHMPGRGNVPYRSNLAVRVYIHEDDGIKRRAVIDPRKLTGTWEEFRAAQKEAERERRHADGVLLDVRRALRRADHRPGGKDQYQISSDGSSVTLPVEDLRTLVELTDEPVGSPA